MGIIGSLIGGIGSVASGIMGGISASKAMKNAKSNLEEQQRKNDAWYNRRYNEDATQRADAQRLLTMTEESIKNRNKAAAGSAAVMGGTDESVAAAKAANNRALADVTSSIAANSEARKDNIEATHLQNDNALNGQLRQMEANKANAVAQATQNAIKGITDSASTLEF